MREVWEDRRNDARVPPALVRARGEPAAAVGQRLAAGDAEGLARNLAAAVRTARHPVDTILRASSRNASACCAACRPLRLPIGSSTTNEVAPGTAWFAQLAALPG